MGPFQPLSGAQGFISIDGTNFPASQWNVVSLTENIPIPTVRSVGVVDILPGWTTGVLVATGSFQFAFNPFNPSGMSVLNGSYHSINCMMNLIQGYNFPSALVVRWEISNYSSGNPIWSLICMGNYKFRDPGSNFAGIDGMGVGLTGAI